MVTCLVSIFTIRYLLFIYVKEGKSTEFLDVLKILSKYLLSKSFHIALAVEFSQTLLRFFFSSPFKKNKTFVLISFFDFYFCVLTDFIMFVF